MFKLTVFLCLLACAFAAPKPGHLLAQPVAISHHVPVATSYSTQTVIKSPVVAAAPVAYAAAPVAYAASPVHYKAYSAHPAPLTYAAHAAPLTYAAHTAPLAYSAHPAPLAYYH